MTYTEEDRRAILAAMPAGAGSIDEVALFHMIGSINSDLMNSRHETVAQQGRVRQAEESLAACETLLASIAARRADPQLYSTIDPADLLDPVANQLETARDGYRSALEMERRVLNYVRSQKSEPADMIVMKAAAAVWKHFGGRVDYGAAFDRFFEAVTGPKFRTAEARRLGLAYVATRKQRLMKAMVQPRKIRSVPSKPFKRR